jgi:hypothetical protein
MASSGLSGSFAAISAVMSVGSFGSFFFLDLRYRSIQARACSVSSFVGPSFPSPTAQSPGKRPTASSTCGMFA